MKRLPVEQFLDLLAAAQPTPGGGSAAALIGAMGAALISMMARLTVSKDKYAADHEEMAALLEKSEALRAQLTEAMQQDIKAYSKVMAAYSATEKSKGVTARDADIQAAFKEATEIPLICIRLALQIIPLARRAVEIGNLNAAADAGVAAIAGHAAIRGAALNVLTNCAVIKDEIFSRTCINEANKALSEAARLESEVFTLVRQKTAKA
ncbi:MAG TPA: cyclodeaminase/cyclohydrolase family protein [Methylophilaceae bacterium]|nr:cyclodeaminase/cyclohydrolase family protein [Methylophilaceae bacterium]